MSTQQNLYYLASPYTHDLLHVMERRAELAAIATAALKRMGLHIFAPIPFGHAIARHGLPGDFGYWQAYDLNMLDRCDGLIVLTLDGWSSSKGINFEIDHMQQRCKPIIYTGIGDLV